MAHFLLIIYQLGERFYVFTLRLSRKLNNQFSYQLDTIMYVVSTLACK